MKQSSLKSDPAKARAWQERSARKAQAKAQAKRRKPLASKPSSKPRAPVKPRNPRRLAKRRAEQHGTSERTAWWNAQPCACGGRHPACTGGWSDPSHTVSRGAGGTSATIIPQSRGCHDHIHAHGWAAWELDAGVDRHALASRLAGEGPDAPGRGES